MTQILVTTTDAEDAAIVLLSFPRETPEHFVLRQIRHALDSVLALARAQDETKTSNALAKASEEDRAAIAEILKKYRGTDPKVDSTQ